MAEDEYKFYLYDRWFYLIGVHGDIRKYASNIDKPTAGIIIEKNMVDNTMGILYYLKNKPYAKISVSDITEKDIFFHYKDLVPHLTTIKGNEYVNLLLECFAHTRYGNVVGYHQTYIQKKRNLRRLCYREPDFPLNMTISMNDLGITSMIIDYYQNLVSNFKIYTPKMNDAEIADDKLKIKDAAVRELVIPSDYYLIDREYHFVKEEAGKINYINSEDMVSDLVINYDYMYHCLTGFEVNIRDNKTNKYNCNFLVQRNEYGGITILFNNNEKELLGINHEKIEGAKYRYMAKYDNLKNQVSNYLEIVVDRKRKIYYHHPTLTTTYVDQDGNSCHIANQNFARLSNMANFAAHAFDYMEKTLVK